jgi:hypothetical protein
LQSPEGISLSQNYPNPFNPETRIRFQIAAYGFVTLEIFDVLGREVRTLIEEWRDAGVHEVAWNAGGIPSGLYFYRISVTSPGNPERFEETRSMTLLK